MPKKHPYPEGLNKHLTHTSFKYRATPEQIRKDKLIRQIMAYDLSILSESQLDKINRLINYICEDENNAIDLFINKNK